MSASLSLASSSMTTLNGSRSYPSSTPPVIQPDHFYPPSSSSNTNIHPNTNPNHFLDPNEDPYASRGIPVFKPSMEEFQDFEGYMKAIEPWGMKSGIVKVIPPQEWRDSLPDIKEELSHVKINSPIEQNMVGGSGKFRQENIVRRKQMTVREWVNLCNRDEFKAPAAHQVGLNARGAFPTPTPKASSRARASSRTPRSQTTPVNDEVEADSNSSSSIIPNAPSAQSKRKALAAEKVKLESDFAASFNPDTDWLPMGLTLEDYSPEFCTQLERAYWRNIGIGKAPWYGADSQGSLFDPSVTAWNVATLPSALTRLLPSSSQGLPGVNTPYLYFGMWRATFAWHVEDMDLFSINYIHFGAPKFWYAIPQEKAASLERTLRAWFPSKCPQFLRHKSYLVSPSILAQSACGKPNTCVQLPGEFMITYPFGYHAGFNLGINCAESVNFALDSWIPIGRKAKVCDCVPDSVRIDVDQLLADRAIERGELNPGSDHFGFTEEQENAYSIAPPKRQRKPQFDDRMPVDSPVGMKRKAGRNAGSSSTHKKPRVAPTSSRAKLTKSSVTPTLASGAGAFPCCLCVSISRQGLLPVYEPPRGKKEVVDTERNLEVLPNSSGKRWMAHEECAKIIPETWVDEVDDSFLGVVYGQSTSGSRPSKVKVVFGVDSIVKDRWALKCVLCSQPRSKAHGALIQCTKGKCPKAFHVSCAKEASMPDSAANGRSDANSTPGDTVFQIARVLDKEVVLVGPTVVDAAPQAHPQDQFVPPIDGRVIKTTQKYEVTLLCAQHNPAVASRKKLSKQNKIRDALLALPQYSPIKIRVAAGVFEVFLNRVLVDAGNVEVLWGPNGATREFKWGSVVWGDCQGVEVKAGPMSVPQPSVQDPSRAATAYQVNGGLSGHHAPRQTQLGVSGPTMAHYTAEAYHHEATLPSIAATNPMPSSSSATHATFCAPNGVLQLAPPGVVVTGGIPASSTQTTLPIGTVPSPSARRAAAGGTVHYSSFDPSPSSSSSSLTSLVSAESSLSSLSSAGASPPPQHDHPAQSHPVYSEHSPAGLTHDDEHSLSSSSSPATPIPDEETSAALSPSRLSEFGRGGGSAADLSVENRKDGSSKSGVL